METTSTIHCKNILDTDVPLVVTYCNKYPTECSVNTGKFIGTLLNNDWEYVVLGTGEIWDGFMTKITACRNFLSSLDSKKVVVIADAHDVFCLRNSCTFISMFHRYKCNMIVSTEHFAEGSTMHYVNKNYGKVTWLDKYFKYHNINHSRHAKKFVNAGLVCGYFDTLLHYLNWIIDNKYTDDQKGLGAYMNAYPEHIYADFSDELLHTTCSLVNAGCYSYGQLSDSPSLNELLGQKSFFLHIPGLSGSKGQEFLYNSIYDLLKFFNMKELQLLYPSYGLNSLTPQKYVE